MSPTGACFDIGITVGNALSRFERTGEPYSGSTSPFSTGNGSLMRLAPVPMFYADRPEAAVARCVGSSRTTHGAEEAVDACRYFGGLIFGALSGVDRDTLLSPSYSPVQGLWECSPLAAKVAEIADGSFRRKEPPDIKGEGYVIPSLEAALWAFHKSKSGDFRAGALKAVNLGDDADTTGAIYGQIAGAYYGIDGIPVEWRERLAWGAEIEKLAAGLYEHSQASL